MYDGVLVNKKEWGFQNEAHTRAKRATKATLQKKLLVIAKLR